MRIVIADFAGHPFQIQLSRELAKRGHTLLHLYSSEFLTPKGRLSVGPGDPTTLTVEPVTLGKTFAKYSYVRRRFQEIAIGKAMAARCHAFDADIVVGSNLPLETLRVVSRECRNAARPFVLWQQDIFSIAIERILTDKFGLFGAMLGRYYKFVESHVVLKSQSVVTISSDFVAALRDALGVTGDHIHVVENWAPLDEILPRPKDNPWSRAHGLADKQVVLYTGTLGMKHNPRHILAAAEALRSRSDTVVVVASEGQAAKWLMEQARAQDMPSLRVVGFQPFSDYPNVLGSADVLISILEKDSGVFSVPSKVLSYLCASRAIVLSAPPDNLASRIIQTSEAGKAIPAGDFEGFANAIISYLDDPALRDRAALNGRKYAEKTFDIQAIGDRFEAILTNARSKITGLHGP